MMKCSVASLLLLPLLLTLGACSRISTDPGTQTVLVDKPYFIGHGGVRDVSQLPGSSWQWWSTTGITVPVVPIKIDERFEDLITAGDNIPVDFNSYLQLQIREPVVVIKNYGEGWYDNNLKEQYRTIVRNEAKRYTLNQLLSDSQAVQGMETRILDATRKLVKDNGLPIAVLDVNLGKVLPDSKILDEINETGRQKQRSKSMEAARLAEDQRKEAESARAAADNAYRNQMTLSPEQFIKLEEIKARRMLYEQCNKGCTVIVNEGGTPLVVGR